MSVLLIEEDDATRALLATTLQRAGYHVLCLWTKAEVMAVLAMPTFDLVITDVVLRGFDGIKVAVELRRAHPATPLLMISRGRDFMTPRFRETLARYVGAYELIGKPFCVAAFLEVVRRAMKKAH